MDLDEWELLPSHGFIDLHESDHSVSPSSSNPNSSLDVDYFKKLIDPPPRKNCNPRDFGEIPVDVKEIPVDQSPEMVVSDQETISQVFFKKLKEKNEFADMKLDSPKSLNKGFVAQIDVGTYQFGEKDEKSEDKNEISKTKEGDVDWEDGNGGLNIWKWAMTGIGALFSFGFAAATVSLIVLGNRNKDNNHSKKTQDLQFQLFTHEKRMKRVVHHATKLNEAINAVRGAPLTTAHITIGGYCEGL